MQHSHIEKKKFNIFSPTCLYNIVPRRTCLERLNSVKGTNKYKKYSII